MTPTGAPPVPHWMRLEFEDSIRRAVTPHANDPDTACGAARDTARSYSWVTTADIANALVNTLGVGWGAMYLHWAHEHQGRRAA